MTKIPAPKYEEPKRENELDSRQRCRARQAASLLNAAFPWEQTAEGLEFWSSVHQRLLAIADGEPLA